MPSLHGADALIIGIVDVRAREVALGQGALAPLAGLGLVRGHGDGQPLLARHRRRRGDRRRRVRRPRVVGEPREDAPGSLPRRTNAVSRQRRVGLKEIQTKYTTGVRRSAASAMSKLGRTRVTPDTLTAAGVTLCIAGSVAVYFEYKGWGWFWVGAALFVLGSILDILDGALARSQNRGSEFGAFIDSTVDRVGEALHARRDRARAHARRPRMGRRARVRRAGRLVPRLLHAGEGRGARPERRRRLRQPRRAGRRDHHRSRAGTAQRVRPPRHRGRARREHVDHRAAAGASSSHSAPSRDSSFVLSMLSTWRESEQTCSSGCPASSSAVWRTRSPSGARI